MTTSDTSSAVASALFAGHVQAMAAKKRQGKAAQTQAPTPDTAPAPVEARAKIASQTYELRAVSSLRLHPENPKKGKVDAIGDSLEQNDFYGAAVVQKSTGFILAGNHRYKAAIEKGMPEIPVIVVDCDDATARRILLADNRIADLGGYDDKALAALVQDAHDHGGLTGTGYAAVDLERMVAKQRPPETFPEFNDQVKVTYTCPQCQFKW